MVAIESKKVVACVIARTWSKRLPLKVLRYVDSENMLIEYLVKRLKTVERIDDIYLCTSDDAGDEILEDISVKLGIKCLLGHPTNVIDRMLEVGRISNADYLIRVTGDNVFTDVKFLERQIEVTITNDLDYTRLIKVPLGYTSEIIFINALKHCSKIIRPDQSEYLMLFLFDPSKYKCGVIDICEEDYSKWTLTVDTSDDLQRTREIVSRKKGESTISIFDIIEMNKNQQFSNLTFESKSQIKLPNGEVKSFMEFQQDQNKRIRNSNLIEMR